MHIYVIVAIENEFGMGGKSASARNMSAASNCLLSTLLFL